MPAPPHFQRAPRLYPELPEGEVDIPPPPPAPTEPSLSLLPVLLPGLFAVGALVATLATMNQSNPMMALLSFGFMGISSITAFHNYTSQRSTYNRAVSERDTKYCARLDTQRKEFTGLRAQQLAAMRQLDPDPSTCKARVERCDRRLWERSPQDADFLSVRVGLGEQPFAVAVKAPRQDTALDPDPLLQAAQQLATDFAGVVDAPVHLRLGEARVAGLAGPRAKVLNMARSLALQIATHHSPDEVKIVAVYPENEAAEWEWMRWLPHVWTDDRRDRYMARDADGAHRLLVRLADFLQRRQTAPPGIDPPAQPLPCLVLFLADPRLVEREPILSLLLGGDDRLGAFPIFLADRLEALPKGCQAIVDVSSSSARLICTAPQRSSLPFAPDTTAVKLADDFARTMAPIRLQRMVTATETPASVALLELLGVDSLAGLDILRRWQSSRPERSLAVRLGVGAAGEPLILDLHERGHGPHGLVAGATGSGKSELLQSLIALLAIQFSPHDVVFMLVDYKGGGMANAFLELPHLVGSITNLDGNLAMRALAAVDSELKRREAQLAQAGVSHIDRYLELYRQGTAREPLPHLVIIVDEFAELKTAQPEFMRELVRAVRVGRSLGVHLILATQKPAGVVDEQIWANSRFRVCLRVERSEDSNEVLKRPDAASLTGAGRAYFQVGHNEVFQLFQAAWAGAAYLPGGVASGDAHEIVEVDLDGSRRPLRVSPAPIGVQSASTQLQAVVTHLRDVAESEGLKRLPGPWLPPLPDVVTLVQVRAVEGWDGQTWQPPLTWLEPAIGLIDDPARQRQVPLRLNLGREGHLAIYGGPGSGKTTLVQTLVTSLALSYSPTDVQMYLLDFGSRSLSLFASLPHVGGVILTDEAERLNRLLRMVLREMEVRKDRFAEAGVNTLLAYRSATSEPMPAIVLVLDNYSGFGVAYPDAEDQFVQIAREGGSFGIHLALTASSPAMLRSKLTSNITQAVALHLTDRSEYGTAVGRTGGLEPAAISGRGLVKANPPLEFQTAVPAAGTTDAERTGSLKALVEQMGQAWNGPRPRPVPTLPDVIPLVDLLPPVDAWLPLNDHSLAAPLGVDIDELEPFVVDLNDGPHFVITGPVQCGKTTFLQAWLLALAERHSPDRLHLYLVDFRHAGLLPLARLPHVHAYIDEDDRLGEALAEVDEALAERRRAREDARRAAGGVLDEQAWLASQPAIVVAIEDFEAFREGAISGTKDRLEQIVRRNRGLGLYVLMTASSSDLASNTWDSLVKALKDMQTGFLLGSSEHGDLQLFNLRLPPGEGGQRLPCGQGYYSCRGRYRKIKGATAQAGALGLQGWVTRIVERR